MSESGHVIHVIETDGIEKEIKLYTNTSDVIDNYKEFLYEDRVLYANTTIDSSSKYATQLKYIDNGVTRYLCEMPPITTTGNIIVEGNIDIDIVVDGNLEVSGTISSNVEASGAIIYGALTGTIKENVRRDVYDISVSDGNLTFKHEISNYNDKLYTSGSILNSNATTVFYKDMFIESNAINAICNDGGNMTICGNIQIITSNYEESDDDVSDTVTAIYNYNNGVFTISSTGDVYVTQNNDSNSAVCNFGDSDFYVDGTLTTVGGKYSTLNFGNFVVSGVLNADGSISGLDINGYNYVTNASFIVKSGGEINATGVQSDSQGDGIRNYCSMFTVEEGSIIKAVGIRSGIYNHSTTSSTFDGIMPVVTVNGTMTATGDTYGIYNTNNSTITCNNIVYAYSDGDAVSNTGTINGTGKIYANDALYYNGS